MDERTVPVNKTSRVYKESRQAAGATITQLPSPYPCAHSRKSLMDVLESNSIRTVLLSL